MKRGTEVPQFIAIQILNYLATGAFSTTSAAGAASTAGAGAAAGAGAGAGASSFLPQAARVAAASTAAITKDLFMVSEL